MIMSPLYPRLLSRSAGPEHTRPILRTTFSAVKTPKKKWIRLPSPFAWMCADNHLKSSLLHIQHYYSRLTLLSAMAPPPAAKSAGERLRDDSQFRFYRRITTI
jgi:hypothetical protein